MIKKFLLTCFCIALPYCNAKAMVKEIDLPVLSYHINNNATYKQAPNKIDNNAVFVLNPGLLLGIDTRKTTKTNGASFLAKGGFLRDCADKNVFALGVGGRYRHFISQRISLDLNGYLIGANAVKNFGTKDETLCTTNAFEGYQCKTYRSDSGREFVLLPLVNVGFNYHLQSNTSIGTTISYIPKNTAIAATSGTDLLFFTVNLGF